MQSYEQVDDFVEMTQLPQQEEHARRRSVLTPRHNMPQPRSRRSMVHTTQPLQSCFDDKSKAIYSSLPVIHSVTAGQLTSVIASSGHTLQVDCASQIGHIAVNSLSFVRQTFGTVFVSSRV